MYKAYLALLRPLISFQSISTNPAFHQDMRDAAEYVKGIFEIQGLNATLIPTRSNPVVYAHHQVNESLPTCLLYGHYDVQPVDDQPSWKSDPFTLIERNGALYGRGVADNKGQFLIHLAAVGRLIREKKLGYNIRFLIEGDEEGDSGALEELLENRPELFKADFMMVSDGQMVESLPTMDIGFRGALNLTLELCTSDNDLHSGLFGGVVPNAARELIRLVNSLHDEQGMITVPGFYDAVPKEIPPVPFNMHHFQESAGVQKLLSKNEEESYMRCALQPSIEITSLKSGYLGEGYRNSIPGSAEAKINIRVCPHQSNNELVERLKSFLKKQAPDYISWQLRLDEQADGVMIDFENEYSARALDILKDVFGKEPVLKYCGGTLPIIASLQKKLEIPELMIAFANEDCAMHGANENIQVEVIKKDLEFSYQFFSR